MASKVRVSSTRCTMDGEIAKLYFKVLINFEILFTMATFSENWPTIVQYATIKTNQESILPNFFLCNMKIFSVFCYYARFFSNGIFFLCYKNSSLTSKTGKRRKTKFGRIDSWRQCYKESLEMFIALTPARTKRQP
jgi:hypothetical protein